MIALDPDCSINGLQIQDRQAQTGCQGQIVRSPRAGAGADGAKEAAIFQKSVTRPDCMLVELVLADDVCDA